MATKATGVNDTNTKNVVIATMLGDMITCLEKWREEIRSDFEVKTCEIKNKKNSKINFADFEGLAGLLDFIAKQLFDDGAGDSATDLADDEADDSATDYSEDISEKKE